MPYNPMPTEPEPGKFADLGDDTTGSVVPAAVGAVVPGYAAAAQALADTEEAIWRLARIVPTHRWEEALEEVRRRHNNGSTMTLTGALRSLARDVAAGDW